MMSRCLFSCTIAIGLGLSLAHSALAESGTVFLAEDFTKPELPAGWKSGGDVSVVDKDAFSGTLSVRLGRTREKFDTETFVLTEAVPVKPGRVEAAGAFKADLESPDSSFNAAVDVEALDASGKILETLSVANIFGKSNWTPLKKPLVLPKETAQARLRIKLNKATGAFWADGLSLKASTEAQAAENPVKRVAIKTKLTGNLFYPGKPEPFEISVRSARELAPENRTISAWVTDYWGAEQTKLVKYPLEPKGTVEGLWEYAATVELSGFEPEIGKYYELRTLVDGGEGDPVREGSAFACLPDAPARAYSWREIPFSSRNWDNRMPHYFELTDRIGIRLAGVWGMWDPKPPYNPTAPGFEDVKRLGLTMLTRTPIVQIEHHRQGYKAYTDDSLRNGVAPFFEKFGQDGEIVITLGNEPQPTGPTVARNVEIYKLMYQQVKKVSPETFVVGTSVGPAEEYFKLGFQKYSDAVDFHTYEDSRGMEQTFQKYKELFAKYGGEQPIWATELGLNAQGLSRRVIAAELIKKFSWFFRFGGANGSWFAISYPDRLGKLRGSAEDAFNVFDGLYGNFSPRLDAIAYYNVVNGICIKKFSDYRAYEKDLHAFLFLDKNGENLQVLWKDHGAKDVQISVGEAEEVKVTRLDGTIVYLTTKAGGVSLRVTEDPILLAYKSSQAKLPEELGIPVVTVLDSPATITRGESAVLSLGLNDLAAKDLKVSLPPNWSAASPEEKDGKVSIAITAPADTDARYVPVRVESKSSDLDLVIPVQGQIAAEMRPAVTKDGRPAVQLMLKNRNARPETVSWRLSLLQEIPVKAGLYTLTAARPASAYFGEASEGKIVLEPNSETSVQVPLAGFDPITPYKIRSVVTDGSGRSVTNDRFFGGFVQVPKVSQPLKLDGTLDDPAWQKAVPREIDRPEQFRNLKAGNWTGPEDLSGKVRFLWDEKYLYVGVEVRDDVFRNEAEGSAIWSGDGLQFLIDPARSQSEKPGKYDYAIGVGKDGPVAWCYLTADGKAPAGEVKEIVISQTPGKNGDRTYELAIPWERLAPFQPSLGANLGMAVILNEDDAPKRDAFMTWFGDIQSKEVDAVGDLILSE
jgi:hypothetical protein